jgi:hypothetical protein
MESSEIAYENIEKVIADFMNEYFQIYINKIVIFVWKKFDVHIDESIIRRILARIRLIYNKIEVVNGKQGEKLRMK